MTAPRLVLETQVKISLGFAPSKSVKKHKMKIFGIGMNYAPHNKEVDGALYKTAHPVLFTKADSSLLKGGRPFFLPDDLGRIDHEAALVVRICRLGKGIPRRFARRYYDAVTVGVDFTARDVQQRLQREGLPWDLCKGFDGSAAIGKWMPLSRFGKDIQDLHFHLLRNGEQVQEGCTKDMLFGVDRLVSFISQFFTLKTGDIIFTGTPVGVGPVSVEDHLEGYLEGEKVLEFNVK